MLALSICLVKLQRQVYFVQWRPSIRTTFQKYFVRSTESVQIRNKNQLKKCAKIPNTFIKN